MGESKPETATQRIRADANITAAWGRMRFRLGFRAKIFSSTNDSDDAFL